MKPRNFPGRRRARQNRAVKGTPTIGKGARKHAHPTVADMRWRFGAAKRDAETGVAR